MNHYQRLHILSTLDLMEQSLKSIRLALAAKDPSEPSPVRSVSPSPEIGDRYTTVDEEKSISEMIEGIEKDIIMPGGDDGEPEEII